MNSEKLISKDNQIIDKILISVYILKSNSSLPNLMIMLLQFMITVQPLFFVIQSDTFQQYRASKLYPYIQVLFRLDQTLMNLEYEMKKYIFLFPLGILLLHKCCLIYFVYSYFKTNEQELILKIWQNQFYKRGCLIFLILYNTLISSFLFNTFLLMCLQSLKFQLDYLNITQNNYALITLNIITIIILISDLLFFIFFSQQTLTNKINFLDKTHFNFNHFLNQVLVIVQIFVCVFYTKNQNQSDNVQISLLFLQSLLSLFEQFYSMTYILDKQIYPLLFGNSIIISFSISFLLMQIQFIVIFLIILPLILELLLFCNRLQQFKCLKDFFFQVKVNGYKANNGLMKLFNEDALQNEFQSFSRILIGFKHSSQCFKKKKCSYCNHLSIIQTKNSAGITNKIYKDFIINQLLEILKVNQSQYNQKQNNLLLLQYAILLYDYGWINKSLKLLYQLNSSQSCNKIFESQIQNQQNVKIINENRSEHKSDPGTSQLQSNLSLENSFEISINRQQDFKFYEKLAIKYVIHCAKKQISFAISGSSLQANDQSIILEYIQSHLQQEVQMMKFQYNLLSIAQQKLNFFQDLSYSLSTQDKKYDIYKELFNLSKNFYQLQKLIKQQYRKKPNLKLHLMYCYFIGEIESNYQKAIQFHKNSQFIDEDQLQFQKIKNFNINSKNIDYVILELNDDMQTLKIISHSVNFFNLYGQSNQQQYKQIDKIQFETLLPNCVSHCHEQYVKQFFEQGNSKYYNTFNLNFISNPFKLATAVHMCFTTTKLYNLESLTFAVFLQEATQDQSFILIDGTTLDCIFTKNLLLLIGWIESDIIGLHESEKLHALNAVNIFPNFARHIKNMKHKELRINQALLHFPIPYERIQQNDLNRSSTLTSSRITFKLNETECDILIKIREMENNYAYYVVDILKINQQPKIRTSQTRISTTTIHQTYIKQNADEIGDLNENPNIGALNSINYNNQHLLPSIHNIQLEFNNKLDFHSQNQETINASIGQLISQRTGALINDILEQDEYFSQSLENSKQKYQNNKQNIANDINIDHINKNYELLQNLTTLKQFKQQTVLQLFLVLLNIAFFLYFLFQFLNLTYDINKIIGQIQSIAFHGSIMGPHDLFFSMRVTITAYQQMNREGFIETNELPDLIDSYYSNISLGYTELRDNMYEQFNNEYIQEYLNDITLQMYFMKNDSNTIYPITVTFRDALFIMLQYQYSQMIVIYRKQSTSGQPFQISLFANYFIFHSVCSDLSNKLENDALISQDNISQKWLIIWILISILLTILFIIQLSYQQTYFKSLNELSNLIQYLSDMIIQQQIQKNQHLIEQLNKIDDYIFEYNPEIQLLQNINNKFTHVQQQIQNVDKEKQKDKDKKLRKLIMKSKIKQNNQSMLLFCFCLLFSFTLIIMILMNVFLDKSKSTVPFFKKISEFKVRPGSLYLYREIFFRWSNFTFLTSDDKEQLYTLVEMAQESIQNYIILNQGVVFEDFLIDDNFITLYQNIEISNLCQYIDEKFKNLTEKYCYISFEGSIEKGMIQSLNYLSNQISTQQAVNNFTQRVEATYYEQEGSQIITRVFFVLSSTLISSIQEVAKNYKFQIQIICISCWIYLIIYQLLIQIYYHPYLKSLLKVHKRMIIVIPFDAVAKDYHLERKLKELYNKLRKK